MPSAQRLLRSLRASLGPPSPLAHATCVGLAEYIDVSKITSVFQQAPCHLRVVCHMCKCCVGQFLPVRHVISGTWVKVRVSEVLQPIQTTNNFLDVDQWF